MLPPYAIVGDFVWEGKQCYEYRVETACCKGTWELWYKSPTEIFYLENGELCPPGVIKQVNEALRSYKKSV